MQSNNISKNELDYFCLLASDTLAGILNFSTKL